MALYVKFECSTCENKNCTGHSLPTTEKVCDGYKHTTTNADRIRAMTDEELAEFMCHNISNGTVNCAFCSAEKFCRMGHNGWLDWLKQKADG